MTGSIKPNRPFLLGVCGGSGSGKTFFARDLVGRLGPATSEIIFQDNFYFDQSNRFDFDGGAVNFDHPSSIDFKLLAKCLNEIKQGLPTEIPVYDFASHRRCVARTKVRPKPVMIVDGILILHEPEVCALFDETIFFDTPEELRYHRRLHRDVNERGRTEEGVRTQFMNQVKPMHDQFVEPSRQFARRVVCGDQEYAAALTEYCERFA